MTYERFTKQLDGCTYCSGGLNCTPACEAMWLYRASQGRIVTTACAVRRLTGDKVGGTNLDQMRAVSIAKGIPGGVVYKPTAFAKVRDLVLTGRYGAIVSIGYRILAGTDYDCFDGNFRGGHATFLSQGTKNYAHYADPGADGRRPTIPEGYQDIPWDLYERAAGALPLNATTILAQQYGSGMVYAYVTPADPILPTAKYLVAIMGTPGVPSTYTPLYSAPGVIPAVGAVSKATYICTRSKVSGLWWYRIITASGGSKTANAGRYFKPNRYTEATPL